MIISIEQSPIWRAQRAGNEELSKLLEELFRSSPERRPASGLEVLLLADAFECSEATIQEHSIQSSNTTVPAESAGDHVTNCTPCNSSHTRVLPIQKKS